MRGGTGGFFFQMRSFKDAEKSGFADLW